MNTSCGFQSIPTSLSRGSRRVLIESGPVIGGGQLELGAHHLPGKNQGRIQTIFETGPNGRRVLLFFAGGEATKMAIRPSLWSLWSGSSSPEQACCMAWHWFSDSLNHHGLTPHASATTPARQGGGASRSPCHAAVVGDAGDHLQAEHWRYVGVLVHGVGTEEWIQKKSLALQCSIPQNIKKNQH